MYETIEVQGQEVPLSMFKAALQAVFDAIPKGKRALLFRQMSLVEVVGLEAYRREPNPSSKEAKG